MMHAAENAPCDHNNIMGVAKIEIIVKTKKGPVLINCLAQFHILQTMTFNLAEFFKG